MRTENAAGPSGAGMWYSSSAGTLCPSGHNSDSSQVWFDVGDRYFGDIELAEPIEEEGSAAVVPNLSPHGMEVYVVDEPSSAVLDASMDILISDFGMDSIRSSVVMGYSTPPLPMFLLGGWRVGVAGC